MFTALKYNIYKELAVFLFSLELLSEETVSLKTVMSRAGYEASIQEDCDL